MIEIFKTDVNKKLQPISEEVLRNRFAIFAPQFIK